MQYLIVHDDGSVRQTNTIDGNDRDDAANGFIKVLRVSSVGSFEELTGTGLDNERWEPVVAKDLGREDDEDWEEDEESDFTELPDDLVAEDIEDE